MVASECPNCGADFPEGLMRCPSCRNERESGELHTRQDHRQNSGTTTVVEEIQLSWQSAWRIAIATVAVASVVSFIGWLVFSVALALRLVMNSGQ